jgi:hypothetical protein
MDAGRSTCRHCRERSVSRARGLCHACYSMPNVRDLYPARVTTFSRRGPGAGYRNAPPPDRPTNALPGSPEKIAVLEERVEAGEALWHSLDAGL